MMIAKDFKISDNKNLYKNKELSSPIMKKEKEIIPSILAAGLDAKSVSKAVKAISPYVRSVHIDIMDGKFVRRKTYRPGILRSVGKKLHKQVHLMTMNPEKEMKAYRKAGAGTIIAHAEAFDDEDGLIRALKGIRKLGARAGASINPETPVSRIKKAIRYADMALVMTVHPGRSGQRMLPSALKKVRVVRKLNRRIDIEVDGGVSLGTIRKAAKAGANMFVAGKAVFGQKDPAKAIRELKEQIA